LILNVTLPFFALVLLGYVAAKRRWVPTESIPAFNGFLLYFSVPAMLFRFSAGTPFAELANGRYFLAWSIAGAATILVVHFTMRRFFAQPARDAAFYGLAAAVSNSGFMGLPMIVALVGERAAGPVILATATDLVVVASIGMGLVGGASVKRMVSNPFLIAMLAGAAFSAFEWTLPSPVNEFVRLLGTAAGPCALFAIGLSLVRPDAPLKTPMLAVPVSAKLLMHPLLVWSVMTAFAVDPFARMIAVLTAALPSAGWVFIFAVRYKADAGRISAAILLSTALAFVTFSAIAWSYGVGVASAPPPMPDPASRRD
jgi:predicted permease